MNTVEDYEKRIAELRLKYKQCVDPADKKVLEMRGKLLVMALNKLKTTPAISPLVAEDKASEELGDKMADVAEYIFGNKSYNED